MKQITTYDLDAIKSRLIEYLEMIGAGPKEKSRGKVVALCPLHDDRKPSLSVVEKDDLPVWYCQVCATGGTLIDLHMAVEGICQGDSIRQLGEMFGSEATEASSTTARRARKPTRRRESDPPPVLTECELQAAQRARNVLYDRLDLQERFAYELGLEPETIRNATMPAEAALGYSERLDRLLYIYPAGIKVRLKTPSNPSPKVPFRWLAGRATEPWGAVHLRFRSNLATAFLVEGETDRLALLEAGVQDLNARAGKVVVASPGTSFKEEWAAIFSGIEVVICFDPDEAGERAAQRVGGILAPVAAKVEIVDLNPRGAAS